MARFRGTIKGSRGEASRLGDPKSGLHVRASGWNGHIETRLFVNHQQESADWATVYIETDHGNVCLYHGPLNKYRNPRGKRIPMKLPLELAALSTQEKSK